MTITEFLLDRIAEDEHRARAADSPDELWRFEEGFADSPADRLNSRYDPARVLAECAAKRAIVDLHFECRWAGVPSGCSVCRTMSSIPDTYPCRTVRHLATVYASHPDYDETWKP